MMANERNVTLLVTCRMCGTQHELKVTEASYLEYTSPNRRYVQDIFSYLTADERELLISNTCNECWKRMFGDEDDEEYEEYELSAEDLKEWQDASCGRI